MRARTFGAMAVVAIPLAAKVLRERAVAQNRKRYAAVITGPAHQGPPGA